MADMAAEAYEAAQYEADYYGDRPRPWELYGDTYDYEPDEGGPDDRG